QGAAGDPGRFGPGARQEQGRSAGGDPGAARRHLRVRHAIHQLPLRRMTRPVLIGMALAALLAFAPAGRAASPDPAVVVKGSLTESDGTPAAFQTVRLLKTRKIRSISDPKARAQEVE